MKKPIQQREEFAKGTPSCFFVMSPFQLFCALEAIQEFEVKDYKVVLVLLQNDEFAHRNEQMRRMVKQLNIAYDEYDYVQVINDDFQNKQGSFFGVEPHKYERLFIGDYHAMAILKLCAVYAAPKAKVLYVDDGNAAISLFQGLPRDNRPHGWWKQLKWYKNTYLAQQRERENLYARSKQIGITCTNSFFTIYSDLPSKKFILYPNTLQHAEKLFRKENNKPIFCVLIVGSALKAYAWQNRIGETELEAITWKQLSDVRQQHPDENILYIPHGRYTNTTIPQFCKILNINYQRIDETIECYLLINSIKPEHVYGYNSTALLNLKRFFPAAHVVNWFLEKGYDNSFYNFFCSVRKYYEQNQIETYVIKYPKPSIKERYKVMLTKIRKKLLKYNSSFTLKNNN